MSISAENELRVGVLKTGALIPAVAAAQGEYIDMFADLLAHPRLRFFEVDVAGGAVLPAPEGADAWLITGSKHGVYDPLPWIAPLCEFVRQTVAARVPLMGFCFGHQLMAEALGGRAEKSAAGWQLGAKTYTATTTMPDWAAPLADAWRLLAVHQDQVTAVPPGATVLAQSPGCRVAMLAYGDVDAPDAISVQPHPEFSPGMVADLITHRLAAIVPEPVVAAARPTLSDPLARTAWRTAVHRYLRLATPAPKDV